MKSSLLLFTLFLGIAFSQTLKQAANNRIFVGAAIAYSHITEDPTFQSVAKAQYSSFTAENECKFPSTEPQRGVFTYNQCDYLLQFARDNGAVFRAHNLIWGESNPSWLTNGGFSPSVKRDILTNHITKVVGHYGNTPYCWDVVNEAVTDQSGGALFKPTIWYPDVSDYVDLAFKTARAANPTVKLFYNDYNIASATGWSAEKSNKVFNMISSMKTRGIPIDGVGLQLHVDINYDSSMINGVEQNIKRYQDIGIEVHMTEIDVSCGSGTPCTNFGPQQQQQQAQVYAGLLKACLSHSNCKSFTSWGITDKYSWLTGKHPLPFDDNYQKKPAFNGLISTFTNRTTVF